MGKTVYKLTDSRGRTFDGYRWSLPRWWRVLSGGRGRWHRAKGAGGLCSEGMLHFYHHPLLAAMLNPIHARIHKPVLWEAEIDGRVLDDRGLKGGAKRMRLVRRMELPQVNLAQAVSFAAMCVIESEGKQCHPDFMAWARDYIDGTDRTQATALAATTAERRRYLTEPDFHSARRLNALTAAAVLSFNCAAETVAMAARRSEIDLDLPALAKRAMEITAPPTKQ